jgi:hypothetical protein
MGWAVFVSLCNPSAEVLTMDTTRNILTTSECGPGEKEKSWAGAGSD